MLWGAMRTAAVLVCWAGIVAPAFAAPGPPAGCPRQKPEPLPAHSRAEAGAAALREAPKLYRGIDLRGMRITRAVLASRDRTRGAYATKCGRSVRARSVVVHLEFPAMKPSSSLSEGVVLVARFRRGFRVWALLH